ncbi:hypothetical protein GCM10025868_03930 [Angustibacter aerolatus]|uniref:Uncharacterized protein n=1 Tax=Angustibacter aerolatus TaxID=1162965 RepID=A0ABQ6JCF5_9ACTN|nr:hypothetical protein GCM10025868_03930 [Angustibacter aerolatus]
MYSPGWIFCEAGSSAAASTNAFDVFTTPASCSVSPIRVALAPSATVTVTDPLPDPA